ncbi:MAG: DUF2849 domain-containing protein [Parvibaculaceae bacterium]
MTTPTEKGKILTANRLHDGEVVFLTHSGQWSENIDGAVLATEPQAQVALETRGKEQERENVVTGVYLFDAERRDGHIFATHIKERIRSLGPTVRIDLGKQAQGKGGRFAALQGI